METSLRWGNTTLGAYVFHFYFRDHVAVWTMAICDYLTWDPTGILTILVIVQLACEYINDIYI